MDTQRDWSINLYNLDIERSCPKRFGVFTNKVDFINKVDDIERTNPKILHYKLDKPEYNLSNADMIGHTGNLKSAKKAIRYIDKCAYKIAKATLRVGGDAIITADHGNAEEMIRDGKKLTSHTLSKVPCILVSKKYKNISLRNGKLSNISPTVLDILGLNKPKEMTENSLII